MKIDQIAEASIHAYTGKHTVFTSSIRPLGVGPTARPTGTLETDGREGLVDQRVAGTVVWYPQPIGFQSEWNVGRGLALNDTQTEVIDRPL